MDEEELLPSDAIAVAVSRLRSAKLLHLEMGSVRPTRRWRAAMARAALQLYAQGDPGHDLRVAIVTALVDVLGKAIPDDELVDLVETMLPLQARDLGVPMKGSPRKASDVVPWAVFAEK